MLYYFLQEVLNVAEGQALVTCAFLQKSTVLSNRMPRAVESLYSSRPELQPNVPLLTSVCFGPQARSRGLIRLFSFSSCSCSSCSAISQFPSSNWKYFLFSNWKCKSNTISISGFALWNSHILLWTCYARQMLGEIF